MKTKTTKIALEGFGSYLGMEKGSFVVRDRDGKEERYPLFESEIGEVQIRSGNTVSVGALASIGFWQIDCLIVSGARYLVVLAQAYGSKLGDSNWNPNADIDGNGAVGLSDLVILAEHYGQHYP